MKADTDDATQGGPRDLLLLRAGAQTFAVFADETDGVAEATRPAPLPHAPRAILGVVCVRGRMLTALDPAALADISHDSEAAHAPTPRLFVVLRGDEQLALAADSVEGPFGINEDSIAPPDHSDRALLGTLERDGARVLVLDPSKIFDAALRGTERRRRRS